MGRDNWSRVRLTLTLTLTLTPTPTLTQVGLDDWARDSDGGERIDQARLWFGSNPSPSPSPEPIPFPSPNPTPDQERFCWSWLELAVLWTSTDVSAETLEVTDCVEP